MVDGWCLRAVFVCALLALGCDRNVERYSDEPVVRPDLARIFPEGATSPPSGAAAELPPPPPARGEPPAAAGADAEPLRGSIELAPSLQGAVPPGAVLFLIARAGPAGPPTAVLRVPAPRFPLRFELGPEHRMIEAFPFTGPFTLSARVDADGDALSRTPGDLAGTATGQHLPGARGIRLLIDEKL